MISTREGTTCFYHLDPFAGTAVTREDGTRFSADQVASGKASMFWSSWFRGDCDLPADPAAQVTWREGTVGPPAGDRGTPLSAEPEPDRAASGPSDGTAGSPREPTRADRLRTRVARLKAWDRDVRIGAGMVAAFCVLIACTSPALNLGLEANRTVVLVVTGLAAVDFGFLLLRWDRCAQQMLLIFPVLLLVGEVTLALLTKGVAADYTGFLTLGFVYIGLTQPRGTGLAFCLLAGPTWAMSQQHWAPGLGIKLGLTMLVWLLLSGFLAVRTTRDQNNNRQLVSHAYSDVLTGLGNRRALSDRVEHLIANPVPSGSSR